MTSVSIKKCQNEQFGYFASEVALSKSKMKVNIAPVSCKSDYTYLVK